MGIKIDGVSYTPDEVHFTDWLTREYNVSAVRLNNQYIWLPTLGKMSFNITLQTNTESGEGVTEAPYTFHLIRFNSKLLGVPTEEVEISQNTPLYKGDELYWKIELPKNSAFLTLTVDDENIDAMDVFGKQLYQSENISINESTTFNVTISGVCATNYNA